jgi:Ca2+-binding EF-hand superfamily protein
MGDFGKSLPGALYLFTASMVLSPMILAQTTASLPGTWVGGVPVVEILQRLGAKLEHGTSKKVLDAYIDHFNRTDPNRDGKHTREEYVEKGRYMTPQARAGIFRAADGNTDGVVTRAEYVLNRIITDEGKVIVQAMDDDTDGLVERTEFIRHATKLLGDRELASQVFSALDGNSDGGIPIPEYLRVWGKWARAGQKSARERIKARHAEVGETVETSKSETSTAADGRRRSGVVAGPPSVDVIFERFDGNKDGKLHKKEIPVFVREFIFPADANKDETVTKQELKAFRRSRNAGQQDSAVPDNSVRR